MEPVKAKDDRIWMVDGAGRCVCMPNTWWAERINMGVHPNNHFKELSLYEVNEKGEPGTVLIHRPSGGLGDIVCLLAGVKALSFDKRLRITLAIPKNYHWLCPFFKLAPNVTVVDYATPHSPGFHVVRARYYYQYFVWCPAGMHEQSTGYRPTEGRIKNFAELLGVKPSKPKITLSSSNSQRLRYWILIQVAFVRARIQRVFS